MKIISKVSTDAVVSFINWSLHQLDIQLNNIQLVQSLSKKQLVVLEVTVQPHDMVRIFEEQWFHYDNYVMLHDINFNEEQPIDITMVLAHSIADRFIEADLELEQVLFSLADIEEKQLPAINHAEYWFITEAKQSMELPPMLAAQEESSLKQGFKTVWHNELLMQPLHETKIYLDDYSLLSLTDQVIQCLEQAQYKWEKYNDEIIKVTYSKASHSWAELILIDEEARKVVFYAVFEHRVSDEELIKLSYILLNENYQMTDGAFELDTEDGELRYRTTLFASEGVQQTAVANILSSHQKIMELYVPSINKYIGDQ